MIVGGPTNPEPKPCIVQPHPSALPTLSQYVIDAYIDLVRGGVLENSGALEVYNQGQRMLYAQPEQDPLGVLSTTLFFLRFHEVCDLSWRSRRTAAVALTAFHKLCTSQRALRRNDCCKDAAAACSSTSSRPAVRAQPRPVTRAA